MVKEGIADFAISDDSDLIAYGCPRVAMKLNIFGTSEVFSAQDFKNTANETFTDKAVKGLHSLEKEEFTYCCIMAGCEYLDNIERVGLKVAIKNFGKEKDFKGVMTFLRNHKIHKDRVPSDYEDKAKLCYDLFNYQTVYDPRT